MKQILLIPVYKNINVIFIKLNNFDNNLKKRFSPQNVNNYFRKSRYNKYTFLALGLSTVPLILKDYFLNFKYSWEAIPKDFSFYFWIPLHLISSIPLHVQFIFIIAVIYSSYNRLNILNKLNKIFINSIKNGSLENEIPSKYIEKIRNLHSDLYMCHSALNNAFAPYIFGMSIVFTVHCVANGYLAIFYRSNETHVMVSTSWLAYFIMCLFGVTVLVNRSEKLVNIFIY